jgi:Zn-dependent protease with chaperone function
MQFLLLLVLAFICVVKFENWPKCPDGLTSEECALLTWTAVAVVVILAEFIAQWTRRTLTRFPARREAALRRYFSWRFYHLLLLIGTSTATLCFLGWGALVREICTVPGDDGFVVPGAELLLLAPFIAGLIFSWACFYDAERAVHNSAVPLFTRPFWTRWNYVTFHARQNLALIAAPLVVLIVVQGLRRVFPGLMEEDGVGVPALALLAGVFICLPWVLRLVLGLRPLPAGPLRQRLEAAAQRLRFRYSNILLWNTHSGVANAMVAGVLPWPRYVVLSDRLVGGLTDDELEAVFGHEVGHVKHSHMIYYLTFLFISLVVLVWAGELLAQLAADYWPALAGVLEPNEPWMLLPFLLSLVLYIFLVFGFLSRRCERQADVYGCRAVSCGRPDCPGHEGDTTLLPGGSGLCPTGIRTFIGALEKVANLNGISRSKPGWLQSWQHSTIARRVEFLQRVLIDPSLEPRFQRRVGQVKWGLLAGLGALLALLIWVTP